MNTSATASSAARGRRVEIQRYRERRSANAPAHRLLGAGMGGPPVGGVGTPERGGGRGREAPRGRPSERQRVQNSAKASVPTPALRRAAQREGPGPSTSATASGAARARLSSDCWVVGSGGRLVAGWEGPTWGGPGWKADYIREMAKILRALHGQTF